MEKLNRLWLKFTDGLLFIYIIGPILIFTVSIIVIIPGYIWYIGDKIFYNFKNRKMKKMETAVLATATEMCKTNSSVTTKEVKSELIKKFPQFHWKQSGDATAVNELMSKFAKEGKLKYSQKKEAYSANTSKGRKVLKVATTTLKPKTVTRKVKALKSANGTTTRISKTAAAEIITNAKGRFGTATFIDKNNEERVMNFQVLADQTASPLGYVKVKDMQLYRVNKNDCIRQINLQTLFDLKINGEHYKIN